MKRYVKSNTDTADYEDLIFTISYDPENDVFVAIEDLEEFESKTLSGLSRQIVEWNRAEHNHFPYLGYEIEDNIRYDMENVKDEFGDYGDFILRVYMEEA